MSSEAAATTSGTAPNADSAATPSTSNTSTSAGTATGRGYGRGGRGAGRGSGRGDRGGRGGAGRSGNNNKSTTNKKKFVGETADMNGHVFQTFSETDDRKQWTKTLEAIGRYINLKMDNSADLAPVHRDLKLPVIEEPPAPDEKKNLDKDHPEMYKWRKKFDRYLSKQEKLEDNLRSIYSLVWGQCSNAMQAKVQALEGYYDADKKCDCIWLLTQIKGVMFKFEGQKEIFHAHVEARSRLEALKQKESETTNSFLEQFQATVEAFEHYGGSIGSDKGLMEAVKTELKDEDPGEYDPKWKDIDKVKDWIEKSKIFQRTITKTSRDRALAMMFLFKADRARYGELWLNLQNRFSLGYNEYPKNLSEAYTVVSNFKREKSDRKKKSKKNNNDRERGTEASSTQEGATDSTEDDVEVNFLQQQLVPGTDGVTHPNRTCFNCHLPGHFAHQCPTRTTARRSSSNNVPISRKDVGFTTDVGTALLQADASTKDNSDDFKIEIMFHQGYQDIPDHWILLDSQSTTCVFRNKVFLSNIRKSPRTLNLITNGGTHTSTLIGDLGNFGAVWYNEKSLANILSLADVRRKCRVTMDTSKEAAMIVHRSDGTQMKFKEFSSGLYFHDPTVVCKPKSPVSNYCLVQTVNKNRKMFHRREIEGAEKARSLHRLLGRPAQARFEHFLVNNLIRNCPVTVQDAKRAVLIYGPDLANIKGHTTKRKGSHIPSFAPLTLPSYIIKHHRKITLCVDIFYVQGITFFHSISRKIKFRTASHIPNRKSATILEAIKLTMAQYERRGFEIADIHADQEFKCIEKKIPRSTKLEIVAEDDHVHEVERSIRATKECTRCNIHGLPYKRMPKIMIIELVSHAMRCLNQFPARDGVSKTMSPLSIVTGANTPDYNKLKIEFGQYAQVHANDNVTNTTASRSIGAIALSATPYENGYYKFMNLNTGKVLNKKQFTILPITEQVIKRVEEIAKQQGQGLIKNGVPRFEWKNREEIEDIDDNEDEQHEQDEEHVHVPDDNSSMSDINDDPNGHESEGDGDDDVSSDVSYAEDSNNEETSNGEDPNDSDGLNYSSYDDDMIDERSADTNDDNNDEDTIASIQEERSAETDASGGDNHPVMERNAGGYNLRSRSGKPTYNHRLDWMMDQVDANAKSYETQLLQHAVDVSYRLDKRCDDRVYDTQFLQHALNKVEDNPSDLFEYVTHFMFNQMSAKKGIAKHGDVAIAALLSEFTQLEDKDAYEGVHVADLTPAQRRAALRAINLIKEKRCGKIKGRMVADGSSQRSQYTKEETSSPTPSNDSIMISLIIDAMERRIVGTSDVPGAYLNADMDDFTVIKITGESVDIFCKMNSAYEAFVVIENGKRVLYLRLKKALYGCIKSALLWYKLFAGTLEGMGFKINPYDTCVANKMVNGKQCTIVWYVDDVKVSHVEESVVRDVLDRIEGKFGKMKHVIGPAHVYLGMHIAFKESGTVEIWMGDQIKEAIEMFGEDVSLNAVTPAKRDLFEVDPESPALTVEKGEIFHSVTCKLLYVAKRCRLDVQLPISFLATRVSKSTLQDWDKLKRVLRFLNGTLDEVLVLASQNILKMDVFVDASYGVHDDMKGHTGGCVTFGRGAVMSKSTKQKLNTKSSTETEIVGCSDYMTQPLWGKKFIEAQGYKLDCDAHQDNKSAMQMEINGRKSCGPKSRHIDIRYFWFHDRIKKGEFNIVHCPTHKMIADFFTKPLQGDLFKKLRAVIMGHVDLKTFMSQESDTSKERVGENEVEGSERATEMPMTKTESACETV